MLKKKSGFTLVELVLALALAGVVMVTGIFLVQYFTGMHNQAGNLSQAQQLAKTQLELIETELRYAYTVNIGSTVPTELDEYYACLFVKDGKILRKDPGYTGPVLSEAGFENYEYTLRFSAESEKMLKTEIWVKQNGKELFYTYASFFVSNLLGEKTIAGGPGNTIVYEKTFKPVTGISITTNTVSPKVNNEPAQVSASISPVNASNKGLVWSAEPDSTPLAATVTPDGLLTPLANGTIKLKATAADGSGVTAENIITIKDIVQIKSFQIRAKNQYGGYVSVMAMGDTLQMEGWNVSPSYATNKTNFQWMITKNNDLAVIDATTGRLTPLAGSLTKRVGVKAVATDGSGVASPEYNITIYPWY